MTTTAATRTRDEIVAEMSKVAEQGRELTRLQTEGGEGYDHTDCNRIADLQAELDAAIVAEWDKETTIARRAAWNDAALAMTSKPTQAKIEATTGVLLSELKSAISRHNLISTKQTRKSM